MTTFAGNADPNWKQRFRRLLPLSLFCTIDGGHPETALATSAKKAKKDAMHATHTCKR